MARRIALTMLSLVGALLLGAVVPLGLITTARERASFRQDTVLHRPGVRRHRGGRLTDRATEPGHRRPFFARASKSGEAGWVYNARGAADRAHHRGGAPRRSRACPQGLPRRSRQRSRRAARRRHLHRPAAGPAAGGRGRGHGRPPAAGGWWRSPRSTAELDERLRVLWAVLAAIAAGRPGHRGDRRGVGRALGRTAAVGRLTRPRSGWAAARSTPGRPPGRVHPRYAAWPATFNTMAGPAGGPVHGNRAMMADVSHQLRTPLAALRLRLDLLAADADEAHRGGTGRRARRDRPAVPAGGRAACGRQGGERGDRARAGAGGRRDPRTGSRPGSPVAEEPCGRPVPSPGPASYAPAWARATWNRSWTT